MSKKYRIILMVIALIALIIIGLIINQSFEFFFSEFWFASGFLLLILFSLIDQPHFSKETSVFINAVTALLSMFLIQSSNRTIIFWAFLILIIYLIASSCWIMWDVKIKNQNYILSSLLKINGVIGKPKVMFSAFFIWGTFQKYPINSIEAGSLILFWVIYMIASIEKVSEVIEKMLSRNSVKIDSNAVGTIFGVQSKNTFLVKLYENKQKPLKLFDFVEFKYSISGNVMRSLIIDVYLLNEEQWIKILYTPEINSLVESETLNLISDVVYKMDNPDSKGYLDKFIGIVTENSQIEKIRFIFNSKKAIAQGQLIELHSSADARAHRILYQVVQGTTKVQQLENKNETSLVVGEAMQLGEWKSVERRFEKFGWVPNNNTPLILATNIEVVVPDNNEYSVGNIPDTNFPILINKEFAVTHHTAILGVTGTGKSVFARNFIRQIASEDTKVIVVDLTGEYENRFENIKNIISDQNERVIFTAIEKISVERSKFSNDKTKLDTTEDESKIEVLLSTEIENFLQSKDIITIFDIPDILNSSSIFDYTKWFFKVLFKIAKDHKNYGKQICVVLEEAHTIIPEYNSIGVTDKGAQSTVNSIAQIALQGRKYNVGFIVIAQRTANVSKTVLTQCNTIISFQSFDKTSNDFLSNHLSSDYVNALSTLKPRTAIAVGKAFRSTMPMIFEVPEITEIEYGKTMDS